MTILDAYAIVAFLRREPAGGVVRRILDAEPCSTSAATVGEVVDRLVRFTGVDAAEVQAVLAQMRLAVIPVTTSLGVAAGRLRATYYHRKTCAVSLADCLVAEAARAHDRPLATSDPHLLDVCDAESIDVVALPDSQGRTWAPAR